MPPELVAVTPELTAEIARLILTEQPIQVVSSGGGTDIMMKVVSCVGGLLCTRYMGVFEDIRGNVPWHSEASGVIGGTKYWVVIHNQYFYYVNGDERCKLNL